MSFSDNLLTHKYFPKSIDIPFGKMLNGVFFNPISDNKDYPLHGPNVIRFIEAFMECDLERECGILKVEDIKECKATFINDYPDIQKALDIDLKSKTVQQEKDKVCELLKIAALFHDIGKYIRRANHPQIGVNLLLNYDEEQTKLLVDHLVHESDHLGSEAKHNRFSLICSIIQHHDKFGVVSTGEGALPIFSDILYFTSDHDTIPGVKKNVTSVMLLNLADIAAVNIAKSHEASAICIGKAISAIRTGKPVEDRYSGTSEPELLNALQNLFEDRNSCLGLPFSKMTNVLHDWRILIDAIEHESVRGNRVQLKIRLMDIEKNPSRTIHRILRLIHESADTSNAKCLLEYNTLTSVEAILVGTLGAHQFQTFCEQLATVVKFDYGLNFFKSILCACIRKEIHSDYKIVDNYREENNYNWNKLSDNENAMLIATSHEKKSQVAGKIATLFIKVLEGLIARYEGVLNYSLKNPRRFGFQMRDLTLDSNIRDTILDLLCIKEYKDPIALTWIADEVTIWSMD